MNAKILSFRAKPEMTAGKAVVDRSAVTFERAVDDLYMEAARRAFAIHRSDDPTINSEHLSDEELGRVVVEAKKILDKAGAQMAIALRKYGPAPEPTRKQKFMRWARSWMLCLANAVSYYYTGMPFHPQ